ncbi:ArsR family transcriptional regulator [Methanosphaera sp. ISO3-F5]|uniref:helix-turn-helix transcriptional regulator n=1 Tax=Methanosphaera sp. ISO3-F5 TaxID=1452353 RepID=UPI002B25827C|nr:ArsR family transcriptional regulator [Methanosphaera sp. ISO3-F5]WQH65047.1 ArsR family transcriptional regulator [Methanosphaera sp. ISO3-F5]
MGSDENLLFNQQSFEKIQYFLTSTFRVEILLELYESDKTVKNLKEILNKSESNILHYLKDFEDKDLIERNKELYTLTSKGYFTIRHIVKLISNWGSINSNLDFWDNHLYDKLPLPFVLNMELWDNSSIVENDNLDYNKPSHVYSELISKSKHIKVILPVLSTYHLEAILNSLEKNDGTLDLITSNILLKNIYASELHERFFKLKGKGKIRLWAVNQGSRLNKFLTCTEKFSSLFLIYDNGVYDDSVMLLNEDKTNVKKLNNLFDSYKETTHPQ